MKLLGKYKNGNYTVSIFDDGTKIRFTEDDEFDAAFPESFDCKICNRCNMECPQCHEKSTCDGSLGNLNRKFIKSLRPYTEIALGGGNVLEQPDLNKFLKELKELKVIPSMTVNQAHFEKYKNYLKALTDNELVYGLGVSLNHVTENFIQKVKEFPNAVIHVIAGIFNEEDYKRLKDRGLKVLFLGYKNFGRGVNYFNEHTSTINDNIEWLKNNISDIISHFDVVSFDNLALKQLDIKSILSEEEWDKFYMGNDGQHTMYIDMVEGVFAKSSTSKKRYPIMNTIDEMFQIIKNA